MTTDNILLRYILLYIFQDIFSYPSVPGNPFSFNVFHIFVLESMDDKRSRIPLIIGCVFVVVLVLLVAVIVALRYLLSTCTSRGTLHISIRDHEISVCSYNYNNYIAIK